MIRKVLAKRELNDPDSARADLAYWLGRPPAERVAAVDVLRRQHHGVQPDFRDLLASLNSHGVEYVIVGGYALAFHGAPRFTGGLDIHVRPDPENAERVLRALADLGCRFPDLDVDDFQDPNKIVQLGVPPVRVDLMTSITGVSWDDADAGKAGGTYGDVPVFFLGREQYVANKRALGRMKDLADLEALGEE